MNYLKISIVILFFSTLHSCSNDNKVTCTTCQSDQSPNFELCKESNGNASVNGEDTGVNYDVYLANLGETGVTCGG
ncbi:MAG: hypothetical protein ACWA45_05615 [Flavobacteriales bacterium]